MTMVRLAAWGASNMPTMRQSFHNPRYRPGLLASYVVLDDFLAAMPHIEFFRDWVLDSGAYSAKTRGFEINLEEFTARAKDLLANPAMRLTEVFALDVIGDWRASLKNTERMWQLGVPAVPCYHQGEPWSVLVGLARDYPRIAIGGMVGGSAADKLGWIKECFVRVWPKSIHGFGIANARILEQVPFATVDATNWAFAPQAMGNWRAFNRRGRNERVRARKAYNLEPEVGHFMRLEARLQYVWRRELAQIGGLLPCVASSAPSAPQTPTSSPASAATQPTAGATAGASSSTP